MANDPPFAALNHVVSDSKIPKESDNRRVGITHSNHTKNRAANGGNPVVDLYDAAGRQSVGFSSLGNDFCRPTSFGSVARPSTMTPTATFGSLATTPDWKDVARPPATIPT